MDELSNSESNLETKIDDIKPNLEEAAKKVLQMNDCGDYTAPTSIGMYPHQWLWDSCFTAIGLRHYNLDRAKTELFSLLRGQWANGMLPNMILSDDQKTHDKNIWRSWLNPNAPEGVATSGITQPPMLAEAVVQLGKKMSAAEKRSWYRTMYPVLVDYHSWLYQERDPHGEGLVLQIHPWETGLDNTPTWMSQIREHQMPLWISAVEKLKLSPLISLLRRDTKLIPAEERLDTIDALSLYSAQRRLRRKNYDSRRIIARAHFAIEDINFNSIFIRANKHLVDIAKYIRRELPEALLKNMKATEKALESLWDPYSGQYYSREFTSHQLIKIPTIGTLMPLYAGSISKDRAKELVKLIEDDKKFGATYPIPSVPLDSEWFKELRYWQGPTWVNTNWLIIEGFKNYGFDDHAAALADATIDMVKASGFYEYFSPLEPKPSGAQNFSWTAALIIDLLKQK